MSTIKPEPLFTFEIPTRKIEDVADFYQRLHRESNCHSYYGLCGDDVWINRFNFIYGDDFIRRDGSKGKTCIVGLNSLFPNIEKLMKLFPLSYRFENSDDIEIPRTLRDFLTINPNILRDAENYHMMVYIMHHYFDKKHVIIQQDSRIYDLFQNEFLSGLLSESMRVHISSAQPVSFTVSIEGTITVYYGVNEFIVSKTIDNKITVCRYQGGNLYGIYNAN